MTKVVSSTEALEKFAHIQWEEKGLSLGQGASRFFVSRKEIEEHRYALLQE